MEENKKNEIISTSNELEDKNPNIAVSDEQMAKIKKRHLYTIIFLGIFSVLCIVAMILVLCLVKK